MVIGEIEILWLLVNTSQLVGGLENEFSDCPFSWGFHHPN